MRSILYPQPIGPKRWEHIARAARDAIRKHALEAAKLAKQAQASSSSLILENGEGSERNGGGRMGIPRTPDRGRMSNTHPYSQGPNGIPKTPISSSSFKITPVSPSDPIPTNILSSPLSREKLLRQLKALDGTLNSLKKRKQPSSSLVNEEAGYSTPAKTTDSSQEVHNETSQKLAKYRDAVIEEPANGISNLSLYNSSSVRSR